MHPESLPPKSKGSSLPVHLSPWKIPGYADTLVWKLLSVGRQVNPGSWLSFIQSGEPPEPLL